MHVLGGLAFFVAAERLTAAALLASDIQLPASVTALCAIGVVAAHPAAGRVLQAALGPGTVWMRAGLPCTLVPAFLFPAICELPDSEALPKLARRNLAHAALRGVYDETLATLSALGYGNPSENYLSSMSSAAWRTLARRGTSRASATRST